MAFAIPNIYKNKYIFIDNHTRALFRTLIIKNMYSRHNLEYRYRLQKIMNLSISCFCKFFSAIRDEGQCNIRLKRFIAVADFFGWDISRNINIAFFYHTFYNGSLLRRLQFLGLSIYDLAHELHLSPTGVSQSIRINYKYATISFFAQAFKFITQAEKRYLVSIPHAAIKNYSLLYKYDGDEVYL